MNKDNDKSVTSDAKKLIETSSKLENVNTIGEKIIQSVGLAGEIALPGSSILGSAAAQGFSKIMGNIIGKKQQEILIAIVTGLDELEREINFTMDKIENKEKFGTTVLQVLPIALRSFEKEKMDALRNVVLNTAIGNSPDDDLHQILLNHLDTLTGWHLKILDYFWHPQGWFQVREKPIPNYSGGSASSGLEAAFKELEGRDDFYNAIIDDLIAKNLMMKGKYMNVTMSASGIWERRVTDMGRKMLDLIRDPRSVTISE
ncbi:MAG: hypothetical protein ACW9W4_01250 [Candidatus Nitrosopumilus sp. bin_7KS]